MHFCTPLKVSISIKPRLFLHDESSITEGGYESAIASKTAWKVKQLAKQPPMLRMLIQKILVLSHFRPRPPPPPSFVIDDMTHHEEENVAESFIVALTLTLAGYESAIVPKFCLNYSE